MRDEGITLAGRLISLARELEGEQNRSAKHKPRHYPALNDVGPMKTLARKIGAKIDPTPDNEGLMDTWYLQVGDVLITVGFDQDGVVVSGALESKPYDFIEVDQTGTGITLRHLEKAMKSVIKKVKGKRASVRVAWTGSGYNDMEEADKRLRKSASGINEIFVKIIEESKDLRDDLKIYGDADGMRQLRAMEKDATQSMRVILKEVSNLRRNALTAKTMIDRLSDHIESQPGI